MQNNHLHRPPFNSPRTLCAQVIAGNTNSEQPEESEWETRKERMAQMEAVLMTAINHPNIVRTFKVTSTSAPQPQDHNSQHSNNARSPNKNSSIKSPGSIRPLTSDFDKGSDSVGAGWPLACTPFRVGCSWGFPTAGCVLTLPLQPPLRCCNIIATSVALCAVTSACE